MHVALAVGRGGGRSEAIEPRLLLLGVEVGDAEQAERRHEREAGADAGAHVETVRPAGFAGYQKVLAGDRSADHLELKLMRELFDSVAGELDRRVLIECGLTERDRAGAELVGLAAAVAHDVALTGEHRQYRVQRGDVDVALTHELGEREVPSRMGGQELQDLERAFGRQSTTSQAASPRCSGGRTNASRGGGRSPS